jgi:hypothetical protein
MATSLNPKSPVTDSANKYARKRKNTTNQDERQIFKSERTLFFRVAFNGWLACPDFGKIARLHLKQDWAKGYLSLDARIEGELKKLPRINPG